MSTSNPPETMQGNSLRTDSLLVGLSFMLFANLLQRGIGFARNISLCHFLSDDMLGIWALIASFFVFGPPMAVLGLPGTLTRFVEYYRQRGQLLAYVGRIGAISMTSSLIFATFFLTDPASTTKWILGERLEGSIAILLVATLLLVILFNFITELLSGLRQPKSVSRMLMVQSLSFTALAIPALWYRADWKPVLVSYGIATVLGALVGTFAIFRNCTASFRDTNQLSWQSMATRIVPYAASMWMMNFLSNAFEFIDRYMLIHLSSSPQQGQSAVGQFHSGCIIPALLTSLTMMLCGILLPYFSADWESGKRTRIQTSMQTIFKSAALGFTALSAIALVFAPWIFQNLLGNRYQAGLHLLPLALAHCTWMSMAMLMQIYLWCGERGRSIALATGTGLLINLGLNYWLIPWLGTQGAMTSTMISGTVVLTATMILVETQGCRFHRRTYLFAPLPCLLMISPELALLAIILIGFAASRSDWIWSQEEKQGVDQAVLPALRKFGIHLESVW